MVLLRRDTRRLEQLGKFMDEFARNVLQQQIDLAFRRLNRLEPPRPPGRILPRSRHFESAWGVASVSSIKG